MSDFQHVRQTALVAVVSGFIGRRAELSFYDQQSGTCIELTGRIVGFDTAGHEFDLIVEVNGQRHHQPLLTLTDVQLAADLTLIGVGR